MRPALLILVILAVALASCLPLQHVPTPKAPSGVVAGVVVDSASGGPLAGVAIYAPNENRGAISDEHGRFEIPNVPVGRHEFAVSGQSRRSGYDASAHVPIRIQAEGDTVRIRVPLFEEIAPGWASLSCSDTNEADNRAASADTAGIKLLIGRVKREGAVVKIWPEVQNGLGTPIYVPESFGFFGHYGVMFTTAFGEQVGYSFDNAPCIYIAKYYTYGQEDIVRVDPGAKMQLRPVELTIHNFESIQLPINVHLRYEFDPTEAVYIGSEVARRIEHDGVDGWQQNPASRLEPHYCKLLQVPLDSNPVAMY